MSPPTKLLVLAIDAASPDLIHRWSEAGELPVLRDLLERGTSGTVRGVEGFYIGSTWPSCYTGLQPAGHGFHRIDQLEPGTYRFHRPLEAATGIGGTPFWKVASDAGRRVAVLDVPLSRVEPELNGVQTVEWGGHDEVFGFRTSPPGLADEILSGVGPYPLPSTCDRERGSAEEFETYVRGLERAVEAKKRLTLDLLDREPWDLFLQVFTEAHCAGHQTWHLHDPSHPAHDPELAAVLGDPLLRVYRRIDRALGDIVERAEGARILLFSAHGMSFFRGAHFLMEEVLYGLGVTAPPSGSPARQPSPTGRLERRARDLAGAAWRRLPGPARDALRPLADALRPSGPGDGRRAGWTVRADVSRSPCFPVQNGAPVGGIRLNLVGREPEGMLRPGPEADAFCGELVRDLRAIVDERTGEPLVSDVYRTDELYAGPRRDHLPDLLVEWSRRTPTGTLAHAQGRGATIRARSPKLGTLEGTNSYVRTGDHVPRGFLTLAGPDVPAGALEEPVSLVDLHPTICRLLELPDPGVDGDVVPALVPAPGPGSPGR